MIVYDSPSESISGWVSACKVGTYALNFDGDKIQIDKSMLHSFANNKVGSVQRSVYWEHGGEAVGKIRAIDLSDSGNVLKMKLSLTNNAIERIESIDGSYLSIEANRDDKERYYITGVAITTSPVVNDLPGINLSEAKDKGSLVFSSSCEPLKINLRSIKLSTDKIEKLPVFSKEFKSLLTSAREEYPEVVDQGINELGILLGRTNTDGGFGGLFKKKRETFSLSLNKTALGESSDNYSLKDYTEGEAQALVNELVNENVELTMKNKELDESLSNLKAEKMQSVVLGLVDEAVKEGKVVTEDQKKMFLSIYKTHPNEQTLAMIKSSLGSLKKVENLSKDGGAEVRLSHSSALTDKQEGESDTSRYVSFDDAFGQLSKGGK